LTAIEYIFGDIGSKLFPEGASVDFVNCVTVMAVQYFRAACFGISGQQAESAEMPSRMTAPKEVQVGPFMFPEEWIFI
jgi:hypothetical protein